MPTYEYTCEKCGHEFEKFQSMADKALKVCPKELCARSPWAKGKVRKRISAGAGLIFKGSGFYITDYRSENYKQSAKKDVAPSTGEAKGAKSGADASAKPAPKSESKSESKPAKPAKPSKSDS